MSRTIRANRPVVSIDEVMRRAGELNDALSARGSARANCYPDADRLAESDRRAKHARKRYSRVRRLYVNATPDVAVRIREFERWANDNV